MPKARARPAAASRPPSGGPTKVLATSSTAYSRLLARVRSSRATIAGSSDWAEVSNRVSAMPSSRATAYSMARPAWSSATARARPPSSTVRTRLTRNIVWRRSSRSARAPATGAASQGSRAATVTPAISTGDRVSCTASRGRATWKTPSARLANPEAARVLEKFRPSVMGGL
jgi:hypothetical protein